MLNFITDSKYVAETISVIVSFADLLPSGTVITGTPVVTVTLFTGTDPNPSNILYQGVTITNGNTVEQRLRLGVIGTIYQINFSVTNNAGQTFDKDSYLAILPDDGNAVPTWLPFWATTQLYPYQEGPITFQSFIALTGGRLFQSVYNLTDNVTSTITLIGAVLQATGITYNRDHEDLKSFIQLVGGVLQTVGITYNIPHEDLKGGIALLGGTLQNASITYNIPHEDIKSFITFNGGTLV